MAGQWRHHKVSDLFDLVPGFAFKSEDFKTSGVPVIKIKNVKANAIVLDDLSYVDHSFLQSKKDKIIQQRDILITMSGNRFGSSKDTWVGKVAYFQNSGAYLLNQRVGILHPKWGVDIDRRCCSYILGSDDYQDLFIAIATSSGGQANLSPNQILGAEIVLPPLEEQRAIAHILGTLDDMIELNRRMNETLEAMTRAIFQSWFVDFCPVRAKAEGRGPGLPKDIADPFPARFEDSELGEIPAGWGVGSLENIASVTMGLSPNGASYNVDGLGTPLINGPVEFGDHFPVKTKWTTSPTRLAQAGDLILCVRGSTTGRRVVADDTYCLGRGVCAIRPNRGIRTFLYQTLNTSIDSLLSKTTGSVFPNLSTPDIKNFPILVPPQEVAQAFDSATEPMTERADANVRESRTLATMRDTLLPKLISGELRLKAAEQFVEQPM